MTPIGQYLIDLFYASAKSTSIKTKKKTKSSRNTDIIIKCYDFDKSSFLNFWDIAEEYNLTKERIRQIHDRMLEKIVIAGTSNSIDNIKHIRLINFVKKTFNKHKNNDDPIKIILFWEEHLPEFPGEIVIRLLAHFIFTKKDERVKFINYYKRWRTSEYKKRKKRERNLELIQSRQKYLLNNVVWFKNIKKWKLDSRKLTPKRQVNSNSDFISGTIESEKCGKEIQYESGLELNFITLIESFPKIITYVEQPVTMTYEFNKKTYKYTPDFAVFNNENKGFLVEVKSLTEMADAIVQRKIEALIDYCQEHGFGLVLTNGEDFLDKLLRRKHNVNFENELRERLNQKGGRTMFFKEFQTLRKQHNAKWWELSAIVLKYDWCLYTYPFKLMKRNNRQKFRRIMVIPMLNKI